MFKNEITFNDLPMVISQLVDKVESLEEVLRQKFAALPSAEKENRHIPLTVKEACDYLKMPAATFYYKVERGEIPAVKQGKRYYIYQDELDRWLESGRKNPVPLTPDEQNNALLAGRCTFGDLTVELCKGFGEYLLGAHQLRLTHRKVRRNSAAGYYSTFRGLLKVAYRDKLIRVNINNFLEKIEWEDVKKSYPTIDELRQLAATPCRIGVLKRASLFSCLTGLRISDVLNLKWEDFEVAPDQGYCIRIRTQKTQTEAILPISYEAIELCGERSTGTVFKGLTRSMVNYPLKKWVAEAGITKPITFHTSRHTFGTMMMTVGADLYTTCKLMGHADVRTTQIYAKIVDSKKIEAVGMVDKLFEQKEFNNI